MTRIAAVQAAPVLLDRDATLARVESLTADAAAGGAELVVFPEVFVPGYPDWVWRTTPWADGARAGGLRRHGFGHQLVAQTGRLLR